MRWKIISHFLFFLKAICFEAVEKLVTSCSSEYDCYALYCLALSRTVLSDVGKLKLEVAWLLHFQEACPVVRILYIYT
jgi:hypothetical protein